MFNRKVHTLFLMLLLAQNQRLAPVNDLKREGGFSGYVKKLSAAVAKRDAKALQKLVDPDLVCGGWIEKDERGWAKCSARWRVEEKDSPVWDVLADWIDLGFVRETPSILLTPYVVWKFPRDLDPDLYWVVLRDNLPLREKPERNGRVVATLAFDLVKRVGAGESLRGFDWVNVETAAGVRGWVQGTQLRSPKMSRGQFGLKEGQWKLTAIDKGED
jgi:hypothetical protein